MKILGIDTTSKFFCVGLSDKNNIYEYKLELGRRQSSLIVPTIQRILSVLKWDLQDIDYFACGLGPGSFTGIRLGLSTIKGFAWVLNKKIIGIPSLDILAANAGKTNSLIVPVVDAKRGLIYCSGYKFRRGALKRVMPYMLLGVDEFVKTMKPNSCLLGDALDLYKQDLSEKLNGVEFLDKDYWYAQPQTIIKLAQDKIRQKEFNDAFNIKPIYLYPDACQVKKICQVKYEKR